jgi:hypothetical protein
MKKAKGRKSNATKLAHKKFRWLRQLRAEPLMPRLGLRICLEISDRTNLDYDGAVIIAQDSWAERYGVCRETFNRTLRRVVALGYLQSIRRGRDRPNAYRIVLKDEAQAADDVCKSQASTPPHDVTTLRTSNPQHDVTETVTSSTSRCDDFIPDDVTETVTRVPLFSPGAPTEPPGRKRETDANASDISSGGGSPPPFGAGPPAKSFPPLQHRARGKSPPRRDLSL